jgi:deferrochelatase/peroxidase EfeB
MPTRNDDFAANDFGFETSWGDASSSGPPKLDPSARLPPGVTEIDSYPPPQPDGPGLVCPHAGHIRKVNPRDQETDIGGADNTLHRRILRRGVPFGAPWTQATSSDERGLMFACYQASIANQFEPTG